MTTEEYAVRVELAALYRIFEYLGWSELIANHITVKVPGEDKHFLMNRFGLHYSEICASNLLKVDIHGNIIGDKAHSANLAGMVIHSAIHAARPDAHCIAHTHTTAGMTVAGLQCGLRTDNLYSVLLHDRIAYHDFEGITVLDSEKKRLVENLSDKDILILRNHGLLVAGPSIHKVFYDMWLLQRACEVQVSTDATGMGKIAISDDIANKSAQLLQKQALGSNNTQRRAEFDAMFRVVEKMDSSFKD